MPPTRKTPSSDPRDHQSQEDTSPDLTDSAAGWEVAKPAVWISIAAGAGALALLAALFLSGAAAPDGPLHKPVLGLLGVCVAMALFGASRARTRLRGADPSLGLEVGLPLLGGALVVALAAFAGRPHSDIDLTVIVQGEPAKADIPASGTGKVWIRLGEERREETLDAHGQVVFAQLPLRFRLGEAEVGVEAPGFETLSPTGPIRIGGRPLVVVVRRTARTLRGEVTDESGVPVGAALVYVRDGPTKKTDEFGRFEMTIPGETAAKEIDFAITAENFLVYHKHFNLADNPEPMLIKLKRVP